MGLEGRMALFSCLVDTEPSVAWHRRVGVSTYCFYSVVALRDSKEHYHSEGLHLAVVTEMPLSFAFLRNRGWKDGIRHKKNWSW